MKALLPRALSPLRHRSLRLLLAGQVTSNVGDACYAVALPWYVLAAHGGTALLGVVLVAYGIPRTGLIAIGGWASDRWGSRTVMLATDGARFLGVGALAAVTALGPARAAYLIPIAVVLGAGEGLFLPASLSIVPSLVTGDDLEAANALATSGAQLAILAGPAIGGALVALASPSLAFALDAVSFAVSAVTLARLRATVQPAGVSATGPAGAPSAAAGATPAAEPSMSVFWKFFRTERLLQVQFLLVIVSNLGTNGVDNVSLPALAHGPLHSGAGGYGLMLAAAGAGALLGSLLAGQVRRPRRPAVVAVLGWQVAAVGILVTPFLGHTLPVAGSLAVQGLTIGFGNILLYSAFQRLVPPALLGRATAVLTLGMFGTAPLSVALAAIFTRDLGTASFFLFAGFALTAAIIFGLSQKSWRDFGLARPEAGQASPEAEEMPDCPAPALGRAGPPGPAGPGGREVGQQRQQGGRR
ncbi:MAG TPA: MFS transporter [Trebonia sp.]|nr:MFS transporter [Trebonia sp.]